MKNKSISITVLTIVLCIFLVACAQKNVDKQDSSTIVTIDNKDEYNYTEEALSLLDTIGKDYKNRSLFIGINNNESDNQHESVINWIISNLTKAGYDNADIEKDIFDYKNSVNGKYGTNIVVTLQGKDETKQIIAGAHYDGDGIGDNGSGVALLLATACGLIKDQPQYTVKFIFFDGEELGELGSSHYVKSMSEREIKDTIYMINIDAIAFGDYCNIYGGSSVKPLSKKEVKGTEGYEYATNKAESLGFKVYRTNDLDGYYEKNGVGPQIESNAFYTNPWTYDHPSPTNFHYASPSTGDWGDYVPFCSKGIKYIAFEATNWYANGDCGKDAYTGYFDTDRRELGYYGMFLNTEYDTLENLELYFPQRAKEHFNLYSPLLSALLLDGTDFIIE